MSTILDIDSILDSTLDNIADVPDFVTPPTGDYLLDINEAKIEKYKGKESEGLRIKLTWAVASTVQVADEKDMPVADGSLFTTTYQATEDGLAYFKKDAKKYLNVADVTGVSTRDILVSLKDVKAMPASIKIRTSTVNGKEFENVNITPKWPAEQAA